MILEDSRFGGEEALHIIREPAAGSRTAVTKISLDNRKNLSSLIKASWKKKGLGAELYERSGDGCGYLVLFDKDLPGSCTAVLIFKYVIENEEEAAFCDVSENDLDFAVFAFSHFMCGEDQEPVPRYEMETDDGYESGTMTVYDWNIEEYLGCHELFDAMRSSYNIGLRRGSEQLLINLAWMYHDGKKVERDLPLSDTFCRLCVDNGASWDLLNLCYRFSGTDPEEDIDYVKAFQCAKAAVRSGPTLTSALSMCGVCFFFGYGTRKNYKKGFRIFKFLADFDLDLSAYHRTAYCYMKGLGVKKDYKQMMKYIRKGVKAGSSESYNDLGYMAETGTGVNKDPKKTMKYYKKAARMGCYVAYSNIGSLYENGAAGEPDIEKAICYYKTAAHFDEEHAVEALKRLGINPDE